MRKNHFNSRLVNRQYRLIFEVEGLNQDRLLNRLVKNEIGFYDVRKISSRKMQISIAKLDSKKFFAISKDMCYNVKRGKSSGVLYFLKRLCFRVGIVLGAILFCTTSVVLDGYVFSIDYYGSGVKYKSQIEAQLLDLGIRKGSKFSSFSLKETEGKLLSQNKNLTFVGLEKLGSRLKVELILGQEETKILCGTVKRLISNVNGQVESLKVFRGTAVVKEGDVVCVGDLLVDGYAVVGEQVLEENVIATITLKVKKEFVYHSKEIGKEEIALLFALGEIGEENVIEEKTTCEKGADGYVYKTILTVRQVIFAG